eukprot:scaffold1617_cov252-Pinguiococcus_pyrenoidosus.AAC.1
MIGEDLSARKVRTAVIGCQGNCKLGARQEEETVEFEAPRENKEALLSPCCPLIGLFPAVTVSLPMEAYETADRRGRRRVDESRMIGHFQSSRQAR